MLNIKLYIERYLKESKIMLGELIKKIKLTPAVRGAKLRVYRSAQQPIEQRGF